MPDRIAAQQALHALFHPRAVAVIGASDDTTKHGYIVLNNVRAAGFTGGIYGISRRLKDVDGIKCYPDLASLPEPVDVAFLAIPADAAVQAVRDCARAGLAVAIVGSAGYAESLEVGGAERQVELARIAAEERIRIVGPNCNGIYNAHLPLSIGFNTAHAKRQAAGGISIFSHSGALFDAMAGRLHMLGAGLSLFASAGNEADLSVLDYMEYAIGHAPTRVIALLIDSLEDGARFRRLALQAAAAGKHVVALKIGGSEAGARAAVAHSSRIAGDNAAYAALFEASGVATVASLEGFMTAAALLERYGRRPGGLGALSTSGAGASLLADRCAALGVPLAALSPDTHRRIDSHRMFSRIGNPLDLGIFGGMRRAGEVPSLLANDAGVSATLALVHSMNPWQGDPIRAALANARETFRQAAADRRPRRHAGRRACMVRNARHERVHRDRHCVGSNRRHADAVARRGGRPRHGARRRTIHDLRCRCQGNRGWRAFARHDAVCGDAAPDTDRTGEPAIARHVRRAGRCHR